MQNAPQARVERRLAAILAADVVGYSRLVGEDEAGTIARLKALRLTLIEPLIAEHHGRIVKLMGDGALCEFASVVDAVACAVAVQQAMASAEPDEPEERRIRFRIGINTGDIIIEDGDIFGDGVNIAARLEGLAEPGGILVSGKVHEEVQKKLAIGFQPLGPQQVKNIAEPVQVWRVIPGAGVRQPRRIGHPRGSWPRVALVAAVGLLVVAVGSGWWWWERQASMALVATTVGIAVLPFDNFSGDPAQTRLADGITEDIITDLAQFRDLDVIARNSTAVYKGKPVDVRQVGRDLGVRYVLEGSLQHEGERVRVTAQLVDAGTGAHVWSERWDRPAQDVFAVQSEIAERVAASLGGGLSYGAITRSDAQRAKRRPPASLSAYEHYLLAAEAKTVASEPAVRKGLEHAEQAIALDPSLARAYSLRGWLQYYRIGFGDDYATLFARVGVDFRKAVELDPLDAEARVALAYWLQEAGNNAEAVAEARKALRSSPSDIHVLGAAASLLAPAGEEAEALAAADRALRLDPNMPPIILRGIKDAYCTAGQFERAIEVIERMPEDTRSRGVLICLAASYAFLGRTKEAEAAKAVLVARHGEPPAERWLNWGFVFARQQAQDLFVEGFRKLGLPVCLEPEELAKLADPKRLPECDAERAKAAAPRT